MAVSRRESVGGKGKSKSKSKYIPWTMMLTNMQKEDLNKAILEYMRGNGYDKAYEQFRIDSHTPESAIPTSGVLEKKWISVLRLQKRVDELLAQIEALKKEVGSHTKLKLHNDGPSDNLLQGPAKQTLVGHRATVTKVLYHPVYALVVSASDDATIRVWDTETGKYERSLKGHTGSVNWLAFNRTGTLLASCSSDLTIRLWKFDTFDALKTLSGHDHNITGVDFLPSGDHLVSASRDRTLKLWEVSSGFCLKTFYGHNEWVRRVAVHPTLPLMISCSQDQALIVWDLANLATPSSSKPAATATTNPSTSDTSMLYQLNGVHENVIETVVFAPEPAVKVIQQSEYFSKFTRAPVSDHVPTNGDPEEMKDGAAGGIFAASGGRDKQIQLLDIKSRRVIATLSGHDNWVREILFHPNGKFLISVSDDKSIRMWDLHTGRCAKTISEAHGHFVTCVDYSDKYLMAATGSVDNSVKLWDCN